MNNINKNGWGLRVELVFIIIFLVCLIIATVGLLEFGLLGDKASQYNNNTNSAYFSYSALENQLNNASVRYYNNYYYDSDEDEIIIRHSTLINSHYMGELIDEDGNKCVGYTKVVRQFDGPSFNTYIKCPKYITNGYTYE
jgi:hypothetical protein